MLAKDIMTIDIVTINASADVRESSKLLIESKINILPVCDDQGKVVGMVGAADIVDLKPGLRVQDIMARNYISVNIDNTMEEIVSIFIMFEKIRQIPVFEEQKLVGVISRQDILKALTKQL